MADVSVNLTGSEDAPGFRSLRTSNGAFLSVQLSQNCTVILPGFDQEACAYARALADVLRQAADACEDSIIANAERTVPTTRTDADVEDDARALCEEAGL